MSPLHTNVAIIFRNYILRYILTLKGVHRDCFLKFSCSDKWLNCTYLSRRFSPKLLCCILSLKKLQSSPACSSKAASVLQILLTVHNWLYGRYFFRVGVGKRKLFSWLKLSENLLDGILELISILNSCGATRKNFKRIYHWYIDTSTQEKGEIDYYSRPKSPSN